MYICTACPICDHMFPADQIYAHASDCGEAKPELKDVAEPREVANAALPSPVVSGNNHICSRCGWKFLLPSKYWKHSCVLTKRLQRMRRYLSWLLKK